MKNKKHFNYKNLTNKSRETKSKIIIIVWTCVFMLLGAFYINATTHTASGEEASPTTNTTPSNQTENQEPLHASSTKIVSKREHTDGVWFGDRDLNGTERSKLAYTNKEAEVKALFASAGVTFPPAEMLWRVFKAEDELEVWAGDKAGGALKHITTYQICAQSGVPGPKRQEGDLQVPEGFYTIDYFNNTSAYYLSMRVSYPNESDKVLGRKPLGHSIMVHGDCVSIGCVAISDERIQELWVMAKRMDQKKRIVQAHLFPGRDISAFIAATTDATLITFWTNILEGYQKFEDTHTLPKVSVNKKTGAYIFK